MLADILNGSFATALSAWRCVMWRCVVGSRGVVGLIVALSIGCAEEKEAQPLPKQQQADPLPKQQEAEPLPKQEQGISEPVEVITNSIEMKLALIPAGEFLMGSPEDEAGRFDLETQHRVRITTPFYLGVYEVTQGEYEQVMGANPSQFAEVEGMDTSRFPVEMVTWEEAVEFCGKLSSLPEEERAGRKYRLPTEAEWEYACRAGTTTVFHFGTQLNGRKANCNARRPYGTSTPGPYLGRPTTVGSYEPNAFGLFDMHGNVCEWCQDWYDPEYYKKSPTDDPPGPSEGSGHMVRGGDWYRVPLFCRSAYRGWDVPRRRIAYLGFRVAAVPPGK
jgi:formylglycine-generating enzyme required for sulfatase activity